MFVFILLKALNLKTLIFSWLLKETVLFVFKNSLFTYNFSKSHCDCNLPWSLSTDFSLLWYLSVWFVAQLVVMIIVKLHHCFDNCFNMLPCFVTAFLPRNKCFLIYGCSHCPQWFWSPENKTCQCFHFFPFYLLWNNEAGCQGLSVLNVEF